MDVLKDAIYAFIITVLGVPVIAAIEKLSGYKKKDDKNETRHKK
jgi:hypothetical protein